MFYIALIPVFRKERLVDLCELEAITGQYSGLYKFLYIYLMHLFIFCMCVHLRGLVGQRTSCRYQLLHHIGSGSQTWE